MLDQCLLSPASSLLDGASLFLDLDGTLFDLVDNPDDVVADDLLRGLLLAVADRLDGRMAIVTGRSLAQVDAILGPVARQLAVSGSHGCEHRWDGVEAHPVRPGSLDAVSHAMANFAGVRPGVTVEHKSYGIALHYRAAPRHGQAAAQLARDLARTHDLAFQDGKMMAEVRLAGGDKGTAVERLLSRAPMADRRGVFVGDDLTDEPAFEAVRRAGGDAVIVGDRRPTAANHALSDPAAVRAWLGEFVA